VQHSIKDKFVERLLELAKAAKIGDPMQSDMNIGPITTPPQYEAKTKHRTLLELIHSDAGLGYLSTLIGVDMWGYPLDGPVPELPVTDSPRNRQKLLLDLARRENLIVRQLYGHVCNGAGHHTTVGTPVQIVDRLEYWFNNGAADGFNILPPYLPDGLEDFVDQVVPELQRRGLFRTEYEGTTLARPSRTRTVHA
jgi:alkanesulfonate monooxygenase SsuD/methylene tetrahydromethanopterin reductase-like flavin-dependent oxidoreductase (luciferase family)